MAKDFTSNIALATRLIDKYGKNVTLVKATVNGGSDYAPSSSEVPTVLRAVDLNKLERADGSLTRIKTRKLLISGAASAVPEEDDTVEINGESHEIDSVVTLNPSDAVILYTVYLVT